MKSIIRDFSDIKSEIEDKEQFLRKECGICENLIKDRFKGGFVVEHFLKVYQLTKRDIKKGESEFKRRSDELLSEVYTLCDSSSANVPEVCTKENVKKYRKAYRYFCSLLKLDEQLDAAEWISERGDDFVSQLSNYINGSSNVNSSRLIYCASTYEHYLKKEIKKTENQINIAVENSARRQRISTTTELTICENKLLSVRECIKKVGKTNELVAEKSNREIAVYQAKQNFNQCRINEIDIIIKNLEFEKKANEMIVLDNKLLAEITKAKLIAK